MKRVAKAAVLTRLVGALRDRGSWCGETHIQKGAYLLQELFEVPLELDFVLYKHGPFSFGLRAELTSLQADELLKLEPQPFPYGPRLAATGAASNLQGRFPKTIADYDSAINRVAQRLGNRGVSALERLATAVYVTRRHADLSLTERAAQLCKLKPHISKDDALGAVREADEVLDEVAGSAA